MIPEHANTILNEDKVLQFRSVLPHEPPPEDESNKRSQGYVLLQGPLLPKLIKTKNKSKGADEQNGEDCTTTNKIWLSLLNEALMLFFKSCSDLPVLNNQECGEIVLESTSRVRLGLRSFNAAKQLFMFIKHRPLSPRDIWVHYYNKINGLINENEYFFSSKPIQATHITTSPLPTSEEAWLYVSPPKFRRLLITAPTNANDTDRYDQFMNAEKINNAKISTRYLYISGLGQSLGSLCHYMDKMSDEDMTQISHCIAIESVRNLIYQTIGDEIPRVEVWIPNWNKKKMVNEKQQDINVMKSVGHCYVGVCSHEIAERVLSGLLGKNDVILTFRIPCWAFRNDFSEITATDEKHNLQLSLSENFVYAQSLSKERLFVDWADVMPRSNSKENHVGAPSRPECTSFTSHVNVPGLIVIKDFVSENEERVLYATMRGPYAPWAPQQKTPTGLGSAPDAVGLKRRVQHYGYVFDYQTADVLREREVEKFGDCPYLPAVPDEILICSGHSERRILLEEYISAEVHALNGWNVLAGVIERARQTKFDVKSMKSMTFFDRSGAYSKGWTTDRSINVPDATQSSETPYYANAEVPVVAQQTGIIFSDINQLTVNEYPPGSGIGSHIDTVSAFGDGLMSISLGSGIVMEFRERKDVKGSCCGTSGLTGRKKLVYLPQRSLVLFSGDARYKWEHMIVSRRTDTVNGRVIPRKLRLSLTLRTALGLDGDIPLPRIEKVYGSSNPSNCYTFAASMRTQNKQYNSNEADYVTIESDPLETPETERAHVHDVYDAIAVQWNHTRSKRNVMWPKATRFIESFGQGALIADVGCGDGKYFPVAKRVGSIMIGTDISIPLLQTSHGSGGKVLNTDVLGADCMMLPFRSYSFDGAICIAVMHHLSTVERRRRCIDEIRRIIKPGGRAMVQAWALEQKEDSRRTFASSDVFVPFNAQPRYLKKVAVCDEQGQEGRKVHGKSVAEMYSDAYDGAEFDVDKGLVIFQRYCHVYRENELDSLFLESACWEILESGYEEGNHFVIAQAI